MLNFTLAGLFRPDRLSWVMATLIVFVAANVLAFSRRYLAGDRQRRLHLVLVFLLAASVLAMAFADHLLALLVAWAVSNLLLVRLMMHKLEWAAARNSGLLALKTFGFGFSMLSAGFWLLADACGSLQIQTIIETSQPLSTQARIGLVLVAIAAMTQSAAWPFHRWLLSSLNSPTPVSALMHAGLVNGGGFLLVRFAPLYLEEPGILHLIFVVGLVTAVNGTFWKLIQTDVKRMLACSTMGQMGFMLMQCGMGLFAPAVSHLCWHGLFKAYSFLNAASVIREERVCPQQAGLSPSRFLLACIAGLFGGWAFTQVSGIAFSAENTDFLMAGVAFMASAQVGARFLEGPGRAGKSLILPLIGLISGGLYGISVLLIDLILEPLHVNRPQPLDGVYLTGFAILTLIWVAMNLNLAGRVQSTAIWKRLYVMALNASQPHPATVTSNRNSYGI